MFLRGSPLPCSANHQDEEGSGTNPPGVAAGQEWCSEPSVVSGSTRICAKPEVIWNKSQNLAAHVSKKHARGFPSVDSDPSLHMA